VLQSVSCNFTLPNSDDRQTQHNLFPSATAHNTIDTNTKPTRNRTLNLTRTERNIKKLTKQHGRPLAPHTTSPACARSKAPQKPQLGRRRVCRPHSRNHNFKTPGSRLNLTHRPSTAPASLRLKICGQRNSPGRAADRTQMSSASKHKSEPSKLILKLNKKPHTLPPPNPFTRTETDERTTALKRNRYKGTF
jgi:hypothetical protein